MFIQTQETPNPHTMKFIPGPAVLPEGTLSYSFGEDYSTSPLASSLFSIEGVKGVFLTTNFISVTKDHGTDWGTLKPLLLAAIMDHFVEGKPVILENAFQATQIDEEQDSAVAKEIKELIDTRVRPAVASDGGDIVYKGFKDGIVYVELHGACSGCPSSTMTLKSGIENMLKHYIPSVRAVEPV